jgi:electron transfer flavoprotein alpha subunit
MGYIKINQKNVNKDIVKELEELCPFNAFDYIDSYLSINAACKLCKLCVKKGPDGVCELIEEEGPMIDKSVYKGITVYVEQQDNIAHPVAWELIGKAKELATITNEPVYALIIGNDTSKMVEQALAYGVDNVFVYEDDDYEQFNIDRYTACVEDFYQREHVNIILIGGTSQGRSFAPRIAARLRTGLTADCTKLDIKENGDLLQIRPAFGGNIMAKIHTPNHRPQLATIRYKMFQAPPVVISHGEVTYCDTKQLPKRSTIEHLEIVSQDTDQDISDAEIIIAVGRAFKKKEDLALVEPLRKSLNAELACTRPLIENGWFDPRRQIGLSGRTVKPKLIINLGISGAVQYIEGMKNAELIISVNSDADNKLFDISHYAIVGDVYEVLKELGPWIESLDVNGR